MNTGFLDINGNKGASLNFAFQADKSAVNSLKEFFRVGIAGANLYHAGGRRMGQAQGIAEIQITRTNSIAEPNSCR